MFDMFRSRKEQMEEYAKAIAPPEPPPQSPAYEVGKTTEGDTTLRIGYTTLTMTRAGVEQLIRILEAAIKDESNERTN